MGSLISPLYILVHFRLEPENGREPATHDNRHRAHVLVPELCGPGVGGGKPRVLREELLGDLSGLEAVVPGNAGALDLDGEQVSRVKLDTACLLGDQLLAYVFLEDIQGACRRLKRHVEA